jgi:HEXXH motif-containing protein
LKPSLRGFSCPYEPFDENLLNFLLREHSVCLGRLLVDRHREELENASQGLIHTLEKWLNREFTAERPIDPAFGEARWALTDGNPVKLTAASVAIALYLGSQGMAAKWNAVVGAPRTLRWGPFTIPGVEGIAVECDGTVADIEVRRNGVSDAIQFRRAQGEWRSTAERLSTIDFDGCRLTFLPRTALQMKLPEQAFSEALDLIEPRYIDIFKQALTILKRYSPIYLSWVGRVLTHVFLLHPQRGYVESGSVEDYFGFSHFSAYANPTAIGELLVHEASHQYFNIVRLLGPFDNGSDPTLYYSPAVKRPRPLDRIGVAYHAFANVLIYYRNCVAGGVDDDGWCVQHLERWNEDLRVLEEPLRNNPAMTDVGRALCDPLIEHLQL